MGRRSETADALMDAIGAAATMALVRHYGGKVVRIPDGSGRPGPFSAWIEAHLGAEAALGLSATFGGEALAVPKLAAQARAARNRLLVKDYDAGLGMLELVRKYDLTERQIRTILNRPAEADTLGRGAGDDKQLGLF